MENVLLRNERREELWEIKSMCIPKGAGFGIKSVAGRLRDRAQMIICVSSGSM